MYGINDKELREHPDWLPFRSANGIIEINFYPDREPNENTARERLNKFISSGLDLSTPNKDEHNRDRADFRLLDTSMSDSSFFLNKIIDEVKKIRKEDKKRGEIQILLADPEQDFAKTRAKSISDDPVENLSFLARNNARKGLRQIAEAVKYLAEEISDRDDSLPPIPLEKQDPQAEINELLKYIDENGTNYNLKLLFYSEVPSGPMYFLQNILIQGRFCSGFSAIKLPWMAIVNNPLCNYDFYDIFSNEFERIWKKSQEEDYRFPKEDNAMQKEIENLRQENEHLRQANANLNERLQRFET